MTYYGLEQQLRQVEKEIKRAKAAIIDSFLNLERNTRKERFSEEDIEFSYLNYNMPSVQEYRNLVVFRGKYIMVLRCSSGDYKSNYYFYGAISHTELYVLLRIVRAIITGKNEDGISYTIERQREEKKN